MKQKSKWKETKITNRINWFWGEFENETRMEDVLSGERGRLAKRGGRERGREGARESKRSSKCDIWHHKSTHKRILKCELWLARVRLCGDVWSPVYIWRPRYSRPAKRQHTQTSEMHRGQLLPSFECVHFDTLQTRQEHFIFYFVRLHQRNREKDSTFSLFASFVRSSFELQKIKNKQTKLCLRMKICVLCVGLAGRSACVMPMTKLN